MLFRQQYDGQELPRSFFAEAEFQFSTKQQL
jgi:hypothetical protein